MDHQTLLSHLQMLGPGKNKQPKADESTQGASLILSSNSNLWTLHSTNKYAYKMDIICDIS